MVGNAIRFCVCQLALPRSTDHVRVSGGLGCGL